MSKRLQITLTDEGYETLINITKELHGIKKSTAIEWAIHEYYPSLLSRKDIGNIKEPCQ